MINKSKYPFLICCEDSAKAFEEVLEREINSAKQNKSKYEYRRC